MAEQVIFDRGTKTALYEDFPLDGGEKVKCLVIQPHDGSPCTRVKADSPEADILREYNPELKDLDGSAAAPVADATPTEEAAQ